MQKKKNVVRHNSLVLLVIALLFIVPFVLAWVYYKNSDSLVSSSVNLGTVVKTPLDIRTLPLNNAAGEAVDEKELLGRWLLLYVNPNACDTLCQNNLFTMRQVRLAVGKDHSRIARAIVTYPNQMTTQLHDLIQTSYKGTFEFSTTPNALSQFLAPLASKQAAMKQGYLYVVDPYGNLMMSYAPTVDGEDVLKDMERLLEVSKIG